VSERWILRTVAIVSRRPVLIFLGAAPEAGALLLLMHRYDACVAKEGCAGFSSLHNLLNQLAPPPL